MPTSEQLTAKCNAQNNPELYESKLWAKARYLVAQNPASSKSEITKDGYYKGCHVIPGPLADPELSSVLKIQDWTIVRNQYFIRFTDNKTTSNADTSVGRANYTIMDNTQADEYEKVLRQQKAERLGTNGDKP